MPYSLRGIDFCGEIIDTVSSHIIFLTARVQQEIRIKGLEQGGDDYITKPFKMEEMLARVGPAMRRREKTHKKEESAIVQAGDTLGRQPRRWRLLFCV